MIGCAIAAVIFWLSIRLSDEYSTPETIELAYALPAGTTFAQDPPKAIEATVTASGWDLLRASLQRGNRVILIDSLDLRQNPDGVISLRREIAEAFVGKDIRVDAVTNPRIVVRTEQLITKRVPLVLRSDISYHLGWSAAGKPKLATDTVVISGPRSRVQEIRNWYTDTLRLSGLRDSVSATIGVALDKTGGITVLPRSTEVLVRVQQYTERSIYVPIGVVGYNGADSLSIFPPEALVTCAVGLEDYERLTPGDFELVVEFDNDNTQFARELPVVLRRQPDYIVSTTIDPRSVEVYTIKLNAGGVGASSPPGPN